MVMSDSRVTSSGGRIHSDVVRKTARLGDVTVAVAGSDQHGLQDLLRSKVRTYDALAAWMASRKQETSTWSVYGYDRRQDRLFALEGDMEYVEYDRWCAGGSGGDHTAGALTLLPVPSSLDDAVAVLQVACTVAKKHSAFVGGRLQWFRAHHR